MTKRKTEADVPDGPAAVSVVRKARGPYARFSRAGSASQCIDGFGRGMEVVGLTYGQFSLIDLIQATLVYTGPADVTISTWSSGFYDLEAANNFRNDGRIRSIRFLIDSGREKRNQAGVHDIAGLFGEEAVVQCRLHAKFVLISNDEWKVVITSSMNLNKNTRTEQFTLSDDPNLFAMFTEFVDAAFREVPEGTRSHGRRMPRVSSMDPIFEVDPVPGVARRRAPIRTGRFGE